MSAGTTVSLLHNSLPLATFAPRSQLTPSALNQGQRTVCLFQARVTALRGPGVAPASMFAPE